MLKFSFRQQVLFGFIVSLLLVFGVFYFSYVTINSLLKNERAIDHTETVIKTAGQVQALILDGETGQRAYIATGKGLFLEPYNKSISKVAPTLNELSVLVQDNPAQVKNIDSIAFYANLKSEELRSIIEIARVKGFDSARKVLSTAPGKYYMDQLRFWVGHVVNEENRLLGIRKTSADDAAKIAVTAIIAGGVIVVCIVLLLSFYIRKSFLRLQKSEENIKVTNIELEKALAENTAKNWLLTGTGLLNEKIQGQQSEKELAENILTEICNYTQALTGTFYLFNEETENFDLCAAYAFNDTSALKKSVKLNEGWLGQAAKNKRAAIIKGKVNDKLSLASSLIYQDLTETFIVPFFFDKKLKGVIEVAFHNKLEKNNSEYILTVADDIGIAINTAQARTIMQDLLTQVQQQAEELEAQQEEMRITNDELLNKTELLQESDEELRSQQEELRTTNAELEEKANLLEEKNKVIEEAKRAIDLKVNELETTGKYKSEFLANMSHELRTPLNSILVLAQILIENKPSNLSADQVKYANVIFNAGSDLLTLINDILDLSKIESGKLEIQNEPVKIADILADMEMLFTEIAVSKKIKYAVSISKDLPANILTDKLRVEQVLKNLLSNAFKFTPENGSVTIYVNRGADNNTVDFSIKDSGIGIPEDKQKIIFEAFQQADGSTSRKYGGTGLGLSISRELVIMLGGEITLISKPGKGSEFTLTIPFKPAAGLPQTESAVTTEAFKQDTGFLKAAVETGIHDKKEPLVIIVEDDKNFANILHDYAHEHGFKSITIHDGAKAIEIVKENRPDAIILDIMLPGKDGWQILKELKHDKETMHIPVHLMSASDAATNRVRLEGAIGFLKKPIDTGTLDKLFDDIMLQSGTKFKQILLIEDNKIQSQALNELMLSQGITVHQAFDGASAFKMLHENEYQCVILDLNLPDISGLDFLDKIKAIDRFKSLPVIINTAMELDKTTLSRLMNYANAMVVKSNKSADRLIDEVNLFLNKVKETDTKRNELIRTKSKTITSGISHLKEKKY